MTIETAVVHAVDPLAARETVDTNARAIVTVVVREIAMNGIGTATTAQEAAATTRVGARESQNTSTS